MTRWMWGLLVLMIWLVAGGCSFSASSATSQASVAIRTLRGGSGGGIIDKTPGAVWLADRKQVDDFSRNHTKKTKIGTESDFLEEVDFSKEGVLVIWMGLKSTGGYALKAAADRAAIENRSAIVPVRRITPKQGAMLTQAITHPYLMLCIGKGDYDSITIIDPADLSGIVVPVDQ